MSACDENFGRNGVRGWSSVDTELGMSTEDIMLLDVFAVSKGGRVEVG